MRFIYVAAAVALGCVVGALAPVFSLPRSAAGGERDESERPQSGGRTPLPAFALSALAGGLSWGALTFTVAMPDVLFFLPMAIILLLASISDLRTMEIPDAYPAVIALFGVARVVFLAIGGDPRPAVEGVAGALAGGGILLLLSKLSDGGIGGGDIKLTAAAGLLIGVWRTLLGLGIASISAALALAPLLLLRRVTLKTAIPFTPFLAVGIAASPAVFEPLFRLFAGG